MIAPAVEPLLARLPWLLSRQYLESRFLDGGPLCFCRSSLVTITQIYSVDFSQSRISICESAFSTNAQSRSSLHLTCKQQHPTVSLFLCSSQSNGRIGSRALDGSRVSSKKPSCGLSMRKEKEFVVRPGDHRAIVSAPLLALQLE